MRPSSQFLNGIVETAAILGFLAGFVIGVGIYIVLALLLLPVFLTIRIYEQERPQ